MVDPATRPHESSRAGGDDKVAWINAGTTVGRTITAAIPPIFAQYATVVVPSDDAAKAQADAALIDVLRAHTSSQSWWLGYLNNGAPDLIATSAVQVTVYAGWRYVLLGGGPQQALTWRRNTHVTPWHSALPELIFPADRSWLVSTLWDDDWRCIGGATALVEALILRPDLETRQVTLSQDATPPGRIAR